MGEGTGPRILLVDEHPSQHRLLEEALRDVDPACRSESYQEATQALEALRARGSESGSPGVDLVLLNLQLPGMHAGDFLRKLKQDDLTRHLPVLAMASDRESRVLLGEAWELLDGTLVPPLTPEKLAEILEEFGPR